MDRAEAYYHFSLGQQARLAGDSTRRSASIRKAQQLDPGSAEIRAEIARLLREAGASAEALAEAEAAVQARPRQTPKRTSSWPSSTRPRPKARAARRPCNRRPRRYEEVAEAPAGRRARCWTLAAHLRPARQATTKRSPAWERFLELDPGSFEAYVQLGAHYLGQGRRRRRGGRPAEGGRARARSARAYQTLADIYARGQQTDQAILNYRKALELEPGTSRVRLSLGDVLFRARRSRRRSRRRTPCWPPTRRTASRST